jgi:hypothetical protein
VKQKLWTSKKGLEGNKRNVNDLVVNAEEMKKEASEKVVKNEAIKNRKNKKKRRNKRKKEEKRHDYAKYQ